MRLLLFIYLFFWGFFQLHSQVAHKIENGETLYRIARQFGVSVKALMDANGINDPTSVKVGTVLNIPGKSTPVRTTTNPPAPQQRTSTASSHKVVTGDTYYNISRRYNISVKQLLAANNRTDNQLLKINEILRIPGVGGSDTPVASSSIVVASRSATTGGALTSPTSRPQNMPISGNSSWPVSGRISKHEGKQGGVRIQLSGPQDLRAVASGTVVYHGRYRELGPIVLVEHEGGYIYIYAGISSSLMKVGDRVRVGDVLGRTTAGRDVVFSVFKDANPIDPSTAPRV
ncbi:MAG: LysM peptidoglycan-binding domain-containing protein [Spirochaetia bacterium]